MFVHFLLADNFDFPRKIELLYKKSWKNRSFDIYFYTLQVLDKISGTWSSPGP